MASATKTSTDDVFINCPFDQDYAPTFRALIFTIYACGFSPRSARELDDGGQTRIDKLFNLIDECRILDMEQYRYQKFISDLAGMDIHEHGGDPIRALRETRDWLANVSRRTC